MLTVVLDAGNSIIKGKRASGEELAFPHGIAEVSKPQYDHWLKLHRDSPSMDYVRVNFVSGDRYFAVGDAAERHHAPRETGPARYRSDYYGVLAATAICRLYPDNDRADVQVFASHPPGHVIYADDLMDSVGGAWDIESGGRRQNFDVCYINVFDEPAGGLANVMLNRDGNGYAMPALADARTLVVDIGGFTTDFIVMRETGEVDYSFAHTESHGILEVINEFLTGFRARYREEFKRTNNLPPDRVREAIQDGVLRAGGRHWDCHEEARQARDMLINRVLYAIQSQMQGAMSYDAVLLTGGGSGLLHAQLQQTIENENVILAEQPDELHMANVRGGLKLWRLYKNHGVIS